MKKQSLNKKRIVHILLGTVGVMLAAVCVGYLASLMMVSSSEEDVSYSREEMEELASSVTTLKITFVSFEKVWDMAMEELIADFEEDNPDIVIEYEIYNETGLYEDVVNKLYARGELGDIVELTDPLTYVQTGLLTTIPEDVKELSSTPFMFDGEVYGVGSVAYTTGILYNKAIFEKYGLEVPETYADFINICETLSQNGVTPLVVGGASRWHLAYFINYFYSTMVRSTNRAWMEGLSPERDTSRWDDAEIISMLTTMQELFSSGYVDGTWYNTTDTMATEYMAAGEAAMLFSSSMTMSDIKTRNSDTEVGWFFLPDDEGNDVVDYLWHGCFCMTQDCAASEAKMEAAERFLEYFYSSGVYEDFYNRVGGMPLVTRRTEVPNTIVYDEVYAGKSWVMARNQDLTNATLPQDFRSYLFQEIRRSLMENLSAEETAQRIQNKWESIREEHVYEEHIFEDENLGN